MSCLKYGIIIAVCIMTAGTTIFNLFPDVLMSLFKAEGDLLTVGIKCLKTISLSFPFAAIAIIIGTLFQATGHGIYSMIISIMRQLVVIVPLAFILSKVYGLMGIWYAYPAAEIVSLTLSLILLRKLYKSEIEHLEDGKKAKTLVEQYNAAEAK